MKRKETRILHGLLTLMLMLGLMLIPGLLPQNAHAVTEYNLCVGGTWVTSGNAENIPKSKGAETTGNASYNAETNTLTLENYKCTGIRTGPEEYGRYNTYGVIEYKGTDQLTIELVGENELKAVDLEYENLVYPQLRAAIFSGDGSFNITGDGKLVAYGPDEMYQRDADGILTWRGNIIIDGPTIYAQAGRSKTSGVGIDAGYVTIKSGSVTAKGSPEEHSMSIGIRASNEIRIEKGVTLVEASGLRNAVSDKTVNLIPGKYWTDPEGTEGEGIIDVNEEGGNLLWIGKKIVFKEVYYPLYVGGKAISTRNEDDVFGNGTVSFVPASGDVPATLTLNNFRFNNWINSFLDIFDGVIAYRGEDTLILEIKGTNELKGKGVNHGIFFNGTLIIKGDGSLSVVGYNNNNQIIYNTKDAHGIYGDSKTADLLIESGTIEASGGSSVDPSQKNNGIKARSVTINGGTVTATGRTYGIDGDVTVSKDMSGVKITGTSGAIGKDSILKNDVSGKGWANEEGTGDGEKIAINTEGMSYSYKKILFNAPPVIVDMPTASAVTYGQTLADSTLTGGTVKDGELEVPGTFAWTDDTIKPNASDSDETEYEVTFTPMDSENYDTVTTKVKLTVNKADLTIKAKDQTYEYDGQPHGEGDPAYDDPAVIAEKIEAKVLQNGDEITSLVLDGAEKEIGVYKDRITITGFAINGKPEAKDNYNVTLLPGTLTITKPQPKPEPQPQTETDKVAPKAMTAKGKNALTIHWRKVSGAQGYDIFFSICGKDTKCKLTKTIRGNKTFSWTKSGLKTKTPYKACVKGWTMKDGKKKYISTSPTLHLYTANGTNNYTVAKSIKVKKAKVKLKAGKAYKIKAKIIKRDKTKKLMPATHTKQLRYISTNKKIATVSKSGKIKAKSKGSCKIYVYAANGVSKAVKVTVR